MKSLLVLTGHTKGLGKAILERFLAVENIQILAISRSGLELKNPQVTEVKLDLSDLEALESKLPELFPTGEFEKVILINNASWIGEVKPIGKLQSKLIQKAMNLNLLAPMILTNAFVETYSVGKCEKLVCNISSGAAHKPLAGWSEYCTGKAGLAMFSKVAAEDLKEKGLRMFSIAPGIVDTGMQAEIRKSKSSDFPALERFTTYKTEGKLSTAAEAAGKIFYLLNNLTRFEEVVQDVRNFDLP